MSPGFKRFVWLFNSVGLVFYLTWLATMGDRQLLREQAGIIYFLPTIPFFFVYMMLINPKAPPHPPPDGPPDRPARKPDTSSPPPAEPPPSR